MWYDYRATLTVAKCPVLFRFSYLSAIFILIMSNVLLFYPYIWSWIFLHSFTAFFLISHFLSAGLDMTKLFIQLLYLIGHSRASHDFLLSGDVPPLCWFCNRPLTVKLILMTCSALITTRQHFYSRNSMFDAFSKILPTKKIIFVTVIDF